MTFFILTEVVGFHSEFFLLQFSADIRTTERVSRAKEDVFVAWESELLESLHHTCWLLADCGGPAQSHTSPRLGPRLL
jgi:hypothetical protein